MKKGFLFLLSSVLLLSLLTGCGAAGSSSANTTTSAGSAKAALNFQNVSLNQLCATTALSSLRPMAASPDGAVIYGGYIKSAVPEDRGVSAMSAADGTQKWIYNPGYDSYTKGIAVDDRGTIYVGIAHAPSENTVSIDVVSSDGQKISTFDINEAGEFGVNGLTVCQSGDRYVLYIVTNYGPNRIYAYDVTDPQKPAVYTGFGTNGVVNLKTLTGNDACEGSYIKANADGDLYLTANLGNGNKGDCVLKITADGTKAEKVLECAEAYGIDVAAGYIFLSTYEGASSHVYAYRESDYSQVMKLDALPDSENYAGIVYTGGKLYVSDQGYQGGARVLVTSSLTSH